MLLSRFVILIVIVAVVTNLVRYLERRKDDSSAVRRTHRRTTKSGWGFSVFAVCVLVSALHTGVNLIYMTFAMLASAMILSWLINALCGASVRLDRVVPSEVVAGDTFGLNILIRNDSRFLPAFCLSIDQQAPQGIILEYPRNLIFKLSAGEEVKFRVNAMAQRRGEYDFDEMRVSTSFPFGLFERRITFRFNDRKSIVLPFLGRLDKSLTVGTGEGDLVMQRVSHSSIDEFLALREYRAGDSPRWIHWKTTARAGTPIVREYGVRGEERALIVLQWCPAVPDSVDIPTEDFTTSFVATLAYELSKCGLQVAFAVADREVKYIAPCTSIFISRIWRELALLTASTEDGSEAFLNFRGIPYRDFDRIYLVSHGVSSESDNSLVSFFKDMNRSPIHLDASSGDLQRRFSVPDVVPSWIRTERPAKPSLLSANHQSPLAEVAS